jgi:hypothetical protein
MISEHVPGSWKELEKVDLYINIPSFYSYAENN